MSQLTSKPKQSHAGRWIALGLLLGVLSGIVFGEYLAPLQVAGEAYVGLLQMTVLPYLAISLIAKMGRLEARQAKKLGLVMLAVMLVLWAIAIGLIVAVSIVLPPVEGATFFSESSLAGTDSGANELARFIPTNIFRSLTEEDVPAVVVFCMFFGFSLIMIPGKEQLLGMLDVCASSIGRISEFLIRLAPLGLFMLSAAAAGTLRMEELARLQAYLLIFFISCFAAAFLILPLLVSSITDVRYRDFLRAANEPLLTAFATGKLFVVLPQIVEKCEEVIAQKHPTNTTGYASPSVVVPLAYPVPHIGKILAFVFISFAAWYMGHKLSPAQTAAMGTTGAVSSFASPLISVPYLLDAYHLPQDLMPLFILPGFLTTRIADVVGVMHLMALTLVVGQLMQGSLQIRWAKLGTTALAALLFLVATGLTGRWYLGTTELEYDLDDRFLSLEIPSPHRDVVVYRSREDLPERPLPSDSTLQRVVAHSVLRVGYHADHMPYSFFNRQNDLVGLDIELLHRLASRLNVRLEFVPYRYTTVVEQLELGEIDMAVGGVTMKPERLLKVGFTQAYQTATLAVVTQDFRRQVFKSWDISDAQTSLRLAVNNEDTAFAARRQLAGAEIVVIDSIRDFFDNSNDLDGFIIAAEEGAAWNILHPEFVVVVPEPVVKRPVGMAVRLSDTEWLAFLDRWLDFERLEGSLNSLRAYWIEGGGTQTQTPRWSVVRDVMHLVP